MGTFNLLYIEDNPVDTLAVSRAIRKLDWESNFFTATDGVKALELLERDQKILAKPLVILLDLMLPKMDGFEFMDKLKKDPRYERIPVMIYSTSYEVKDIQEAYKRRIAGYFTKPSDMEKIEEVLRIVINYWSCAKLPE